MARRKGGLFLPLEVGFVNEDKVVDAGEKAAWLYLAMALFCKGNKTDGVMTRRQIERLGVPGWAKRLADLMRPLGVEQEPLVEDRHDGTFFVRAWFNHNDPAKLVNERLEKDAARKQSARRPNGQGAESEPSPDVEQNRVEQSKEQGSGSVDLQSSPPLPATQPKMIAIQRALETIYRKPYPMPAVVRTVELILNGRTDIADPLQYVIKAAESDRRRFAPPVEEVREVPQPRRELSDEERAAAQQAAAEAKAELARVRASA